MDGYQLYFTSKFYTDNLVIYQKNISKCGHIQVLSTDYQSWNGWFPPLELWPTSGDLTSSHFRTQVLAGITVLCLVGLYIVWDCLSCYRLWARMAVGNFHHFQRPLTVPKHSPNGKQIASCSGCTLRVWNSLALLWNDSRTHGADRNSEPISLRIFHSYFNFFVNSVSTIISDNTTQSGSCCPISI